MFQIVQFDSESILRQVIIDYSEQFDSGPRLVIRDLREQVVP